jgi:hypothetical protein
MGREEIGRNGVIGWNVRFVAYEALLSLVNQLRYLSSIQGIQLSYCLL